jgi:hypothetical protein
MRIRGGLRVTNPGVSDAHMRPPATALTILVFAIAPGMATPMQTNPSTPQTEVRSQRDGQHDFDFAFGTWKARLRRLLHPLSGSHEWISYQGTAVVRKIWDGRANLGELDVDGSSGHIEGLSLRLYNPGSRQWSIYFANRRDGRLGTPMIGQFTNGRGEFFDQEEFQGRAVFVRFIFSGVTRDSFGLEQSFSADGGKTWEPNWIATFTRERP